MPYGASRRILLQAFTNFDNNTSIIRHCVYMSITISLRGYDSVGILPLADYNEWVMFVECHDSGPLHPWARPNETLLGRYGLLGKGGS